MRMYFLAPILTIILGAVVVTACTGFLGSNTDLEIEDEWNNINEPIEMEVREPVRKTVSGDDIIVLAEYLESQPDYGLALYRFPDFRDSVISFYSVETGSERVARLILDAAEINNIPLSLAFSLAWVESRYNPHAVNHNESSIDRGLFQLNSRSFPGITEAEFFDPEVNSQLGMDYFRQCLDAGESEIIAMAMYNAGRARVSGRGTPLMTLEYISRILEYREDLEQRFTDYCLKGRQQKAVFKTSVIPMGVDRTKGIK